MLRKKCALCWMCEHKFIDPSMFAVEQLGEAARNADPEGWIQTVTHLAAYVKTVFKAAHEKDPNYWIFMPYNIGYNFQTLNYTIIFRFFMPFSVKGLG